MDTSYVTVWKVGGHLFFFFVLENKQNRPENLKIVQKPGQKEVSTCYIIIMRESKIESFEQIYFLNDPFWSEPPEISKMESFTTIVNGWKGFHYCFKALLLGVCKSPNCCFHYGRNFVSLHIRTTLHQLSSLFCYQKLQLFWYLKEAASVMTNIALLLI